MQPFSCQTCGKSFARSANLKEHEKIHTGEKNYQCTICLKKFTNSSTFSKHKKIHSGQKVKNIFFCILCRYKNVKFQPHHCSVCDRSFSQHAHLVKHTRIHTNEKVLSEDIFFFKSNLLLTKDKNSISILFRTQPYGCEVCHKYFRRSDTLANHLRTHLKDDRNNYHKKVCATTDTSEQLGNLQVPVVLPTVDMQLIQQTNHQIIENVPQIIYTITTPANVTGVTTDQMNMELMDDDAQTNPHFIITSL